MPGPEPSSGITVPSEPTSAGPVPLLLEITLGLPVVAVLAWFLLYFARPRTYVYRPEGAGPAPEDDPAEDDGEGDGESEGEDVGGEDPGERGDPPVA
jgi:hypothetical protein